MTKKALAMVMILAAWNVAARADDWPQWRGPHGNGVSTEKDLPSHWSKDTVAWRAPLGGLGVSSPVVFGDRVFVTSQVGRGARRPGVHPTLARGEEASAEKPLGGARAEGDEGAPRGVEFVVEAFHRQDGRRLWQYRLASEGDLPAIHDKHNLASPSPVTDGRLVYAWFGTGQLAALDMDGRLIWRRNLAKEYSPFEVDWGHGSSPALYGESLYLLCDHKPASYLLALDKRTGKEKWKADRGKERKSHSTPTLVTGPRGDELVVNSSERIDAYDPRTGELLWYTGEPNRFPIPVPTFAAGVLYASRGYRSGPYMAIRAGGRGDVTRSHVQWSVPTGAPYVSSLVHYDGLVYMANDAGIVTGVDAKSGEKVWQERIPGIFTASPVAGDGKVYLLSETGEVIVLAAGRQPRVLERNVMDERMVASPAVSRGQIFIRTDGHLLGIGRGR
jgi:outer membrane protein assembly factor BamB